MSLPVARGPGRDPPHATLVLGHTARRPRSPDPRAREPVDEVVFIEARKSSAKTADAASREVLSGSSSTAAAPASTSPSFVKRDRRSSVARQHVLLERQVDIPTREDRRWFDDRIDRARLPGARTGPAREPGRRRRPRQDTMVYWSTPRIVVPGDPQALNLS
jgi:hypothetical protein